MDIIRLHDLRFKPLIGADVVTARVKELAMELKRDLKYEQPLFIGILNGVFVFAAELMKYLDFDCEITFVKLSSYNGTSSTGEVKTHFGLDKDVKGRNIVILEDIIDSGRTITEFVNQLKKLNAETIRIATLLFKPDAIEYDLNIDYVGFRVPNEFLVGYGLDYDGLGRNLKDIYVKC